jgi:hypothetical protein
MESTRGEHLTDTFRFKHHAIPVPSITPTNRIIAAMRALTAAITGVQELPPNKLQAIKKLRRLLLGKIPPFPAPIDLPPLATPPPPPIEVIEEEPVHIWDPNTCLIHHTLTTIPSTNTTPNRTPQPSLIAKDDNVPITPVPHAARPVRTHAQHCSQQCVHLINLVITEALMPMIDLKPIALFPSHGYVAATRPFLENTYAVLRNTQATPPSESFNFIHAIVDNITGDVLEYGHLNKSDTHCPIWQKSFANKLGHLFQGIRDIKGNNTCFFIRRNQMPSHKRATNGRICCNYQPQKDEPHCSGLTMGGDCIT